MLAQEDLHTDLDVLAGLDQLPHERLQLVVPLDQIAEVGVQGLLWSNTHIGENTTNGKRLRNEVAKKIKTLKTNQHPLFSISR